MEEKKRKKKVNQFNWVLSRGKRALNMSKSELELRAINMSKSELEEEGPK